MRALTYETAWRCIHCQAAGVVAVPTSEACDAIYAAVIADHTAKAPEWCRLHSGLAIQPTSQQGKLQEVFKNK